jgi:hypothetical protein
MVFEHIYEESETISAEFDPEGGLQIFQLIRSILAPMSYRVKNKNKLLEQSGDSFIFFTPTPNNKDITYLTQSLQIIVLIK